MSAPRAVILYTLVFSAAIACGDGDGPGEAVPSFTGTLDGGAWVADTAVAMAFGSLTDTTISVSAVRRVSIAEEQQVTLALRTFSGEGQFPLADTGSLAIGAFTVSQLAGGVIVSTKVYMTQEDLPGSLTITGIDRTDSVVTGSYAFEAATAPDTAPHRHLSGQFRVRFGFTPVFTIPVRPLPPN